VIEGIAAVAIVFIMFTALAQTATALIAHRVAQGAVAAAAERTALAPASAASERERLRTEIQSTVPGARNVVVRVVVRARAAHVSVRFGFEPPGPMFRPIVMEVVADAPLVVDP
jgi:hypothetical protein